MTRSWGATTEMDHGRLWKFRCYAPTSDGKDTWPRLERRKPGFLPGLNSGTNTDPLTPSINSSDDPNIAIPIAWPRDLSNVGRWPVPRIPCVTPLRHDWGHARGHRGPRDTTTGMDSRDRLRTRHEIGEICWGLTNGSEAIMFWWHLSGILSDQGFAIKNSCKLQNSICILQVTWLVGVIFPMLFNLGSIASNWGHRSLQSIMMPSIVQILNLPSVTCAAIHRPNRANNRHFARILKESIETKTWAILDKAKSVDSGTRRVDDWRGFGSELMAIRCEANRVLLKNRIVHSTVGEFIRLSAYGQRKGSPAVSPESHALHPWRLQCQCDFGRIISVPRFNCQERSHLNTDCWSAFDNWNVIELQTSLRKHFFQVFESVHVQDTQYSIILDECWCYFEIPRKV